MGKKRRIQHRNQKSPRKIQGAAVSNIPEDSGPYTISFKHYKERMCEIKLLQDGTTRSALIDLKKIGCCYKPMDFKECRIDFFAISESGDYAKLYVDLPPDAEVKEHKLSGTGRIFYFLAQNKFCVVAITYKHLRS